MTYATVRSAAEHIARAGAITPHQLAAFSALDQGLTDLQRQGFTDLWRAKGSPAAKQSDLAAALKLIKEFEGCHLEAYADPLHGWDVATIGFGTTRYGDGRKVQQGDKINAIEADMLLRQEVDRIAEKLRATVPFWVAMADHQKCALISFAYNLGSGFYGASGFETISRELREKNWTAVPAALLLYRNPGTNVEAGLKRRREAEVALFVGQQLQQAPRTNPLPVPWFAQMDSADRGQAARMCFSSSCAMLLEYLKPGTLAGPNGDDQYLKRVQTYGDTTDAKAQIRALSLFGVRAKFTQSARWADIERQITNGIPVPCGFLHRGPVSNPGGGGHWLIVVGFTQTHLIVHDPFGEADLVNGTTLGGVARFMRYSRQNFGPRWMAEGPGSGWAILAERLT